MRIRWFCPSVLVPLLVLPSAILPQATPDPVLIQERTHIVLLNVIAKDKHGKPVNNLTRDDFVLRDNGQEQKIGLFALEEAGASPTAASTMPVQLTFTNRPGPNIPGVTVFLFDELNTKLTDEELAKRDFLRFLRELPADSRVAVFVLGDSLSLLHDFTQDMSSLVTALSKHTNRVNPELSASTAPPSSANSLTGDQSTSAQWDAFMKASNQPYSDYAETVRATRTAAALEVIAAHLQGIPGRKTLIWISGGFPIQLGLRNSADSIPDSHANSRGYAGSAAPRQGGGGREGSSGKSGGSSGGNSQSNSWSASAANSGGELPGTATSFESDVTRAVRALNEADVAVYPVNARGVTTAAIFQADRGSIGKRNRPPKGVAATGFDDETLQLLADQTGGQAFHHINDLSAAIDEATSDGRLSYSMTFSPSAASLDGSYHRLELIVKRTDIKLRYRPGYVAARDAAVAPSLSSAITNPVQMTGLGFTVHLDPVEGGYKASVIIDPRNLTLEPKDGKWTGSLQFIVLVGKTEQLTTMPLNFTEAVFHQIQEQGLHFSARVKTPPGTTGFSLGFRDIPSGMVGTLHVPL